MPRGLGLFAALALFAVARPGAIWRLLAVPGPVAAGLPANLVGFAVMALPGLVLPSNVLAAAFAPLAAVWFAGGALSAFGVLVVIAPPRAWRELLHSNRAIRLPLAALGLLTPELIGLLYPLWRIEAVADVTFRAVVVFLDLTGYAIEADPLRKVIGAGDFHVQVSGACSGIEGFALVTLFLTIHLVLFRQEVAIPAALLLYPIGLAASWALNILRIAILLVIGIEGAPDLAVGGFHSRAGWLAFTILAFGLIYAARSVPAFRRGPAGGAAPGLPPFFHDPAAAALLPFSVFMLSAVGTVSEPPVCSILGGRWPWWQRLDSSGQC